MRGEGSPDPVHRVGPRPRASIASWRRSSGLRSRSATRLARSVVSSSRRGVRWRPDGCEARAAAVGISLTMMVFPALTCTSAKYHDATSERTPAGCPHSARCSCHFPRRRKLVAGQFAFSHDYEPTMHQPERLVTGHLTLATDLSFPFPQLGGYVS